MLQKNNKILEVFLEKPSGEFHLRELSRLTNLSTTAVNRYLNYLVNEGIILKEKNKVYNIFRANRENRDFKEL